MILKQFMLRKCMWFYYVQRVLFYNCVFILYFYANILSLLLKN